MAESEEDFAECRRMYRRVWYQKQQAKKSGNYNESYWEHQLEKYRSPIGKKLVVHKTATTAYRNDYSRKRYKEDPIEGRSRNNRAGFRWVLKEENPVPEADIDIMLNLIAQRLAEK